MKSHWFVFSLSLVLLSITLNAQEDYFQQEVHYKITAKLDDSTHTVIAMMEIDYTNNAPDALNEIYFHLWPNAYSTKETAFAKQKLRDGSTRFHYAKPNELGGLSNLDFTVDGTQADWAYDEKNPDIALVKLANPIPSGATVKIVTPFTLKIPSSFSRLGHVGTSYQMTQWYPKPAVYDKNGWHPMPYLNLGEFYSEFGSFDVSITLPENYVVGATGVLQTESEKAFLAERVAMTQAYIAGDSTTFAANNRFPASSEQVKTIRYTAENVHDFAWFADKRFRVLKDEVTLDAGNKVDTWVMYTQTEEELWKDAIEYVNRSVKFYSEKVGEYPYPHATAIQSALSAGGGMEYPMITVIGISNTAKALDQVITHEVGHNWFYGILGTNERAYAWMDEGINSYYESLYMNEYYGKGLSLSDFAPDFLLGGSEAGMDEISYLYLARQNKDIAPNTPANEMDQLNYGIMSYMKPAIVFKHLEAYLGTTEFDEIMQGFYDSWKFKHPYPEDLKAHFEQATGKNLSWFFDAMLFSNERLDYALTSAKLVGNEYQLKVVNKGDIAAPLPVSAIKNEEVVETKWYEGAAGQQEITFPAGDYDDLVIDVERWTIDFDRADNRVRTSSEGERSGFGIGLIGGIENDKKKQVYVLPSLGWNNYDKFMLGLAFHNKTIPNRNFEFGVNPMYAFGSDRISGLGTTRYNIFPNKGAIRRISLQVNGRTFAYGADDRYDFENYFTKIAPKVELTFKKKTAAHPVEQKLSYRFIYIDQDNGRGIDIETLEFERVSRTYGINELRYEWSKSDELQPIKATATVQQGEGFSKLFAHYNQDFAYEQKDKGLKFHAFAGTFFNYDATTLAQNGVRPNFFLSGTTSSTFQKDYLFDQVMLGRSEVSDLLSRQVFDQDARFKTMTNVGSSSDWMVAAGLRSTLPGLIPVELFADAAISQGRDEATLYYSTGLVLPIIKNVVEVYFPVFESSDIDDNHNANGREGFFERTTFRISFDKLNPFELIDNLGF